MYSRSLIDHNVSGQLVGREVLNQSLYVYNKTCLPGYILTTLATGWRWLIR